MSQFLDIHPTTPQARLIRQAVDVLKSGGIMAYPTDSTYALACRVGDKAATARIRRLRGDNEHHKMTLICRDLSELASYARVEKPTYRLLKALTPGAYTFVLRATREVPRRLQHPKRKTIGIRVPDNIICRALLSELGEPLTSATLVLPNESQPVTDPDLYRAMLKKHVDVVIDGGACGIEPTTIVNLSEEPVIERIGKGDIAPIEAAIV